jgi:hypothetical protein
MKQTVNLESFMQAFHTYNRYEQFGYEALKVLFEYLEECDPDMELDVIAICCDYSHSDTMTIANDYSIDLSDCAEAEDRADVIRDWLNEHTSIIGETDSGFVYCSAF